MANNMTILDLVTRATTPAIRARVTKATPNSHKENTWSVVKASCTSVNDKPVTNPVKPPTHQSLIAVLAPLTVDGSGEVPQPAQNFARDFHMPAIIATLEKAG
jgi:hypothetical protein